MATITEIAPDVHRISTYIKDADLQFCQFLIKDDEPLLFHTGMKQIFPAVHEAVKKILPPSQIRWISFSHFEADECGALNEWLAVAPHAQAACSMVGALVSVNDFATRPARVLNDQELFTTGKYRFRFRATPHVPHCWEAGHLFEETHRTLLCSDLFHQNGDVEPLTESDVIERTKQSLIAYQATPLANYLPYTPLTEPTLHSLADLHPNALATMHGSTFVGNGRQALKDLAQAIKEVLGQHS
ncbi:MAG: MBL fold metallo-hydrolase [Nitrospiraceae bacterium]